MKTTIVYVFKIIAILIVSGILWFMTIGTLNPNDMNGYFDSRTPFKAVVWGGGETGFIHLVETTSDNYGYGFESRTSRAWNSAKKESGEGGGVVFIPKDTAVTRGGNSRNRAYTYSTDGQNVQMSETWR